MVEYLIVEAEDICSALATEMCVVDRRGCVVGGCQVEICGMACRAARKRQRQRRAVEGGREGGSSDGGSTEGAVTVKVDL